MLSKKEYRKAVTEASKSMNRAFVARPKTRAKLHETQKLIKAAKAKLERCRTKTSEMRLKRKSLLLRLTAARAFKKCRRYRGDIVLAGAILEPRTAWKKEPFTGALATVVMPSDLVPRQTSILDTTTEVQGQTFEV